MAQGPPYLPNTAAVGGAPTVSVDVPICSVLLALYLAAAIIQTIIFVRNRRHKEEFRLSLILIYMGFFRTITLSLRMAWATHLSNISLALAAQVFVTAGVLLLFILNLVFVLRLLRATHPHLAYNPLPARLFQAFAALVVLSLIAVVTCFVQSLYTLDTHVLQIAHGFVLYGASFFLVTAFFPVLFVSLNYLALRRTEGIADRTQEAGPNSEKIPVPAGRKNRIMTGSVVRGSLITLLGALLLTLGAGFRAGTSYAPARLATNPAWYHHRACFYIFNFVTELALIYLYTVARVDKIFYVPDIAVESVVSEKTG